MCYVFFLPLSVSLSIRRLLTYFRLPRSTGSGPAVSLFACFFSFRLYYLLLPTRFFRFLSTSPQQVLRAAGRCIGTFAMNLLFGRSFSIYSSRRVWYQPQTMTTFIRLLWGFFSFFFFCSLDTSPRSVMPHLVIEGIADCLVNCVNILVKKFLGGRHQVYLIYLVTSIFLGNSTRRKWEKAQGS
jgi:hypothetical protein